MEMHSLGWVLFGLAQGSRAVTVDPCFTERVVNYETNPRETRVPTRPFHTCIIPSPRLSQEIASHNSPGSLLLGWWGLHQVFWQQELFSLSTSPKAAVYSLNTMGVHKVTSNRTTSVLPKAYISLLLIWDSFNIEQIHKPVIAPFQEVGKAWAPAVCIKPCNLSRTANCPIEQHV